MPTQAGGRPRPVTGTELALSKKRIAADCPGPLGGAVRDVRLWGSGRADAEAGVMTKRVVILGGGTGGTLTREPAADDHGAEVRVIERRPAAFRPSRALIPACPHPSGHCSLCRVKLRSGTVVNSPEPASDDPTYGLATPAPAPRSPSPTSRSDCEQPVVPRRRHALPTSTSLDKSSTAYYSLHYRP
jgi:hypothetical protein